MKEKVMYSVICARLERAIHADVGMEGLMILTYGWERHPRFRAPYLGVLDARIRKYGEGWMTPEELINFSIYAGKDLTCD